MKLRLSILLLFLSVISYGQEFFDRDDPDFVYGVGVAESESAADSLAMSSLAMAIYTDVMSETNYRFSNHNGRKNQSYANTVNLKSHVHIKGSKKIVNRLKRGKYEVYEYINKREYVNSRIEVYTECLNKAIAYEKSTEPHSINYALGMYYTAYCAVNDEVLNVFYPQSVEYRNSALNSIKRIQDDSEYIISQRQIDYRDETRFYVRDENARTLPGIECLSVDGKWDSPVRYMDGKWVRCESLDPEVKWAVTVSRKKVPRYRFTFEKPTTDGSVILPVPDSFYVPKYVVP